MASRKTPENGDPTPPDFDLWWPIFGADGVHTLIVELGGKVRRSYVPKLMSDLPAPDGEVGNGYWWWRWRLVKALREAGRVPA